MPREGNAAPADWRYEKSALQLFAKIYRVLRYAQIRDICNACPRGFRVRAGLGRGEIRLENGSVKFELDENGRLSSLKNKASGAEYAGGGDLWRIIYSRGDSLENEWLPSDAPP